MRHMLGNDESAKQMKINPITSFQRMCIGRTIPGKTWPKNFCPNFSIEIPLYCYDAQAGFTRYSLCGAFALKRLQRNAGVSHPFGVAYVLDMGMFNAASVIGVVC